jgi:hypothetical protein
MEEFITKYQVITITGLSRAGHKENGKKIRPSFPGGADGKPGLAVAQGII